jgi:outer membrane receptor protein involved in Fe transport
MNVKEQRCAMLILALCLTLARPARCADNIPTDPTALDDVVVTANKRVERAQDVGGSVSVISGADLENLHVTSLSDLAGSVPGLVINSGGSPGQTNIVLRGLNSQYEGALVATLIDDVPVGSSTSWALGDSFQLDMLPYDVDRIEVLRGPQGTLYGANTMAGLLKYDMKYGNLTGTDSEVGADIFTVTGGGGPGREGRASVSTPLIDGKLGMRASVYERITPGFIINPLLDTDHANGVTQKGGRLALLWRPWNDFSAKVQFLYQGITANDNNTVYAQEVGTAESAFFTPGAWIGSDRQYAHPVPQPYESHVKFASGTLNWKLGFADLTSATGYSQKSDTQALDLSQCCGNYFALFDPADTSTNGVEVNSVHTNKFDQELRLASPSGGTWEWLAGTYFTYEHAFEGQTGAGLDQGLAVIPSLASFIDNSVPSTYKETAVFGNLTYRISDAFDATAGIRWLHNSQVVQENVGGLLNSPPSQTTLPGSANVSRYLLGARYHLAPDQMIYLRMANGYRPGVPNTVDDKYPGLIPVESKADTLVSYELGYKSEFLEHRASIETAVYLINWSNLQTGALTPDGLNHYIVNAGEVRSQGVEFSSDYKVSRALRLSFNAAYSDVYATSAVPTEQIAVGARMPTAPKWTAALRSDYTFDKLGNWTPSANGSWRYIASEYSSFSSSPPVGVVPGYSLVDLNAALTNGRVMVEIYARNVLDKRAYNFASPTSNYLNQSYFSGVLLEPRTIGVSVNYWL